MNPALWALIAALAMTAANANANANAADHHHARHAKHSPQPPFDMEECLTIAARIYASPERRQVFCDDMRAGA